MKRGIIGSEIRNSVSDLKGILKFQEKQIKLLFKLWNRLTDKLECFAMKWYLIIPVYEFMETCSRLSNLIRKLSAKLPDNVREEIYLALRKQKELRKECENIKKILKPARDKVGAHLFTDNDGNFITWQELADIFGSIPGSDLEMFWAIVKQYFHQLEKLVDGLEEKGYTAPSPQPKRVSVTHRGLF